MTISEPSPHPRSLPRWEDLGFRFLETDFLFHCQGARGDSPVWEEGGLRPFEDLRISPAAAYNSYGMGIFEGLKARRTKDGRILLFRPDANARRFVRSAERLSMEPFPAERFVEVMHKMVAANERWVPPEGLGSFYLRPLQHATEPMLGLSLPGRFAVTVFGSPVGEYFGRSAGKAPGLRLRVLDQGRVAPGGTGAAKAMGNYAGSLAARQRWQGQGYDDILYLDAEGEGRVTETSGSNVFLLRKDGRLVTPALDDQILAGITRDSVLTLAREVLGLTVEERDLAIEEVEEEGRELFCTGTAWVVQGIREIDHGDRTTAFEVGGVAAQLQRELIGIQSGESPDRFGWVQTVDVSSSSRAAR